MATSHGSKANLTINSIDYSSYLKDTGISRDIEEADTSTLGNTAKTYIPGLVDGSIPLSGMYDPTIDATLSGLVASAAVAFAYGPAGTTVGLPKYTGNVILSKYSIKTAVNGAATFDAEFKITGAVTRTTF